MILYQRVKNKLSVVVSLTTNLNYWGCPVAVRYVCPKITSILGVSLIQFWVLCFGIEFEWFHYEKKDKAVTYPRTKGKL